MIPQGRDDLAGRLREHAHDEMGHHGETYDLLREAADRIDALEAQVAEAWESEKRTLAEQDAQADIECVAERDALAVALREAQEETERASRRLRETREALELVLKKCVNSPTAPNLAESVAATARGALKGLPPIVSTVRVWFTCDDEGDPESLMSRLMTAVSAETSFVRFGWDMERCPHGVDFEEFCAMCAHHPAEEWVGFPMVVCAYCVKPWPCEEVRSR